MELCQGIREYDGVTLRNILHHVFANHSKMDDHLVNKNMDKWRQPPDTDLPIDVYFAKQEECQRLARDSETPIDDPAMALMLTTHMGATGLVNKPYVLFTKLTVLSGFVTPS